MSLETTGRELATNSNRTERILPLWFVGALTLTITLGAAFYLWVLFTRPKNADMWGGLGSAVGPFVALLNAGVLLTAFWSIGLQRRTLQNQQSEIDRHMNILDEQRKEFTRSADAHQELARAEYQVAIAQLQANALAELAIDAQKAANLQMRFAELAQRRSTMATLYGVVVSIDLARASANPAMEKRLMVTTTDPREFTEQRITEEGRRIRILERELGIDPHLEEEVDV